MRTVGYLYRRRFFASAFAGMLSLGYPLESPAGQSKEVLQELLSLDIESLLAINVTTVSKKSESILLAPGTVYVITEAEIRRNGWRFLQDALKTVPSVYLYDPQSWVWGGQRGLVSNFSQTLLMINGREMNNLIASEAFISRQFATHNIKRIEVMASPGSALYGANALAGVINIITREMDPEYAGLELGVDYGSFNSRGLSFVFGERLGAWRFSGSGMVYESDEEDFTRFVQDTKKFSNGWEDNNLASNSINAYDNPSASQPLNLQVDYQDYYLGVNYYKNRQSHGLEKLRWDYTSGEDNREMALFYGGVNTPISRNKKLKVEYQRTRSKLWGRYAAGHDPGTGLESPDNLDTFTFASTDTVDPNLSFAQNLANNGYIDPDNITDADIRRYFTHTYSNKKSRGSTRDKLEIQFDWDISDRTGLIVGYTYDAIRYVGLVMTDAATGTGSSFDVLVDISKRKHSYDNIKQGVFAQIKSELSIDRFWLTAGVRADRQEHYGASVNPRLGLVWQARQGSVFKLLYGEAFREPNVFELASDPDVKPAKLRSYEANYSQTLGREARLFLAAYKNNVSDFLGSVGSNIGSGIGKVEKQKVTGVEFRLDAKYRRWMSFLSGSLIVDGKQTGQGQSTDILSIPTQRANAGVTYRFLSRYSANLLYRYTGAYDALSGNPDSTNIFTIQSAHQFDATLSMQDIMFSGKNVNGFFTITNITDATVYQANVRRSGPHKFLQGGRAAYFRLVAKW
ncbi:MAG: TonB-dependent receptor plug domain-containing protein [Gammaproteobacteria bacterium]|nr:TonB-dependent receptor plug domain-containing protein [Gammaproteobacteria bacterium]